MAGHTSAVPGTSKDDEPARQDPGRDERAESQDGQRDPPADSALILEGIRALHGRLDELEQRVTPPEHSSQGDRQRLGEGSPGSIPAWKRPTDLSFTNAAAFSPTDVMPLSRWAKMGMTVQAAVSIVTVALVVARAVNILN